jgi:predicted Zn-dependent protease
VWVGLGYDGELVQNRRLKEIKCMLITGISKWVVAAGAGLALLAFAPGSSFAVPDAPKEEASAPAKKAKAKTKGKAKAKAKAKTKAKEKQKDSRLDQDQVYSVAYWQAKGGEYAAALATLRTAEDQNDPRVQTMMGFTLRKLGHVDEAMGYYQRVLAAYPERTTTRQYLGEAFLQIGDVGRAREQLAEIGKRCGTSCEDYQLLADAITNFERAG